MTSPSAIDRPARAATPPSTAHFPVCSSQLVSNSTIPTTTDLTIASADRDPDVPNSKRSRIARRCRRIVNKIPMASSLGKKLKKKTNSVRLKLRPLKGVDILAAAAEVHQLPHDRRGAIGPSFFNQDDDTDPETAAETATEAMDTIEETTDAIIEGLGLLGDSSDFFDTLQTVGEILVAILNIVAGLLSGM